MPKTYVYEGENYTEQEVLEASSNLNMSVDDYVSQYNLEVVDDTVETEPEKKDKDTQKKEDATAVSTSGASSSEDTSSDSTSVTKEKKPPSRIKDNSVDDWYEYYTGGGIDDDIYKADAAGDTKELDRLRKEKEDVSAAIENDSLYVLNDPTLGTLEIDFTKRTKEEVPEFEEEEVEEVTDILSQRIQEPLDVDKPKNREVINQAAGALDQDPIFTDINTKDLVEEDFINIRSGLFPVEKEDGTIGYEYNMNAAEGSLEVFYDTDKYPQGQAIMEVDKTIGGNEIATQRITMQGIAVDPEFKTLTTPGDFTIIAPGPADEALGITENTIVAYNGDDVIAQAVENDKKRIDEASEAYIPKSLRPLEEFMDAKQKELESLTNIFSDEGFEAARTDEFYGKWQKILNDIDKEIAKYERKGLLKQGTTRLYDYVTGEFVDEEQANSSIQASYNASDKKYQNTSYDKLKQMRYDKANELIYLANQVYKEEGIIKQLSSNLLNLPSESGTLGGVQDPALQHIRDKFPGVQEGKFKKQEEIIEEVGVDFTGTDTGVDGNLLYDFWKFKKINETKNLEPGMTLIPEVTLNAKRYNDALIEFNQINRALELNIDEKRTARDTIVDNFFRGAFRSFNASTYKNEAELKSYVADFQKQIYGGEEFWNEYDEFAKGTFWERNIEGVSEGLFPFMVVILEFYLASKWLKGAQTLAGGVVKGKGFPSIYEYVKNNAYKYIGTGWTNPFTSRLGLKTVQYSTAVFEEYMTIQGVNFLNNFSGQEDISNWFALGAGLSRGLLDDFSKWAASGNSKVLNNILSKYNKSRTVGSIMNGTLEPTIGVGVITVGELGEYIVTGEFGKIDDLLELDRLSQLWMTLWITRFAKVDGWKKVSEFSKKVVQDYERIILGKSIRINQAQKRLGVTEADGEADIQEKLNAEVEKVNEKYKELKDKEPNENKRKKLEEQRKEEIENLVVDGFYCQQYANYKYMLATQAENSKIDTEIESQINDIANSIIDGEPGRTPKSLEDLATWTSTEGGQKLIMENIKTKEPDLTPDQIKAYEQAIREIGAVAQRAVKELDFMNIPKGSKLRNQILNAYAKADQINFEINKLQQKLKEDPDSPYKLAMEGDIEFLKKEQQRQAEKIKKLVDKHKENLRKLREIVKENEELKRLVDEGKVEYLSEAEWNARNLTSNTNIDGIAIDGERAIVNVDRMDKKFSIGTETHEVLHLLEGKSFKEAPQEKKDKAVSNFKKQLTPEEQRVVKARLPKRYHDTNSEEWMNYYHQAVLAGTIKPGKVEVIDETFNDVLMEGDGAKIKAWLDDYSIKIQKGALKSDVKTTIRNIEDNVAEEGYKPVTKDQLSEIDYNVREEFTGGEEASVNQTEQLIIEKENINAQNRAMLQQGQINRDVLTANQERVKEINKELQKSSNKINKIFIDNKDVWESTVRNKNRNKEQQAQYDKIFNELYNAYQGLFIEKTNAYKNAYGLSEVEAEDFKAGLEGKRGFIDAIESFDISKQNENWGLDGWINSILDKRAPEFLPPDIGKPKSTSIDEAGVNIITTEDPKEIVETEETVQGYRSTVPFVKSVGKQTRLFKINGDRLFQGEKIPEETVNELKNFTSSNKDEPHLIFMAGGAGSGKTSVISELQKLDPNLKNYKVLNQDPYLEKLKEENGLPADESNYTPEQRSLRSKLSAEAQRRMLDEFDKALSEGENIILDGTAASPKALQKKLNQAQENGYTPNNTAMIAVETSVESAQAANEARPERRLPSSIVRRNHEQLEKAFAEYEVMFSEFDRGNKILGQAAKYLKVNDLPTDINDNAVRDEAYDKAVEDLGTRYQVWKEVKNDLGNRAEYEKNLKEVYNLMKDLDPYLLRKYNVDIFYEPIMTESGGSQKKINNKLQWRKRIPTFEEFKAWTLADPNTINPATGKNYGAGTKGTRKDLLAKIIASQVQMDGILEVSRIAAENNGLVPVYDASGNPTGKTIDLFEGLTPGEKAERIDDAYLNKLSNKLRRRDPNQQFSEVEGEFKDGRYVGSQYDIPQGSFKDFVEEFKAAPLNERKDVIEKYFGKGKEGQEVQEDLKPITELSREEVERYSATEQEESFPIKGEFGKSWVNSVEIHNEKHGTDIKYKSSSGIRSIFAEAAKGDKAAIKQVRNYYNQMHDLYYSLPEAFREAFPTELRALFGINKLKQYYTPEGDMSRYTLKILEELDKHNLDNPLDQLFNLYNSKPRKKPKISEEEKEANEEANEYYKEVLKAANLHSGSSASGKVKIELNKWLDSKDIKQGEKIPEELIPELKKLLQDKIKKKDYSFDETVDANKEVITILVDSIKKQLDKIVDKYGVDSNEFNTYMDNTVIFLSSQTNIADSPLKGAFTITSVATVRGEPTSYQPGGFHAEHNVAIFLFNNNLIDYLIDYAKSRDENLFNDRVDNLITQSEQAITTAQTVDIQDHVIIDGKKVKVASDFEGELTSNNIFLIKDPTFIENAIDLKGDPNEPVTLIDKFTDIAITNDQAAKLNELEIRINEMYDQQGEDLIDKIQQATDLVNKKIFNLKHDQVADQKVTDKSINDLEKAVEQYSEVEGEFERQEFDKFMDESFGDQWRKAPSSDSAAKEAGKEKDSRKILPYSAQDWKTLLYNLLPKKGGEEALKFIEDKLIKPYFRGLDALEQDQVKNIIELSVLNKSYKSEGGPRLSSKPRNSNYTYDQEIRMYIWDKAGYDIPGATASDIGSAVIRVENNPTLKAYADQLINMTEGEYTKPNESWVFGDIGSDISNALASERRSDYIAEWKSNVDNILNNENKNKLRSILGNRFMESLDDIIKRMESGSNRQTLDPLSNNIMNYINQTTGATMFFNTRSAAMQMISSMNYLNTSFNNPIAAARAFADQPQFWKDVGTLWKDPYLVSRRGTGGITLTDAELRDISNSKNSVQAWLNKLLEKGYTLTQIADSFAQVIGGAPWYRNKVKDLMKKNPDMTLEEAQVEARNAWRDKSRAEQQSGDPAMTSKQQTSTLGRTVLQYATTQQQYMRRAAQDLQDLLAGRGSFKEKMAGLMNYLVLQNAFYGFLINAGFSILTDESTPDDEKAKLIAELNSIIDANLRGLGVVGSLLSTGKNAAIKFYEEANKDRPNYEKVKNTIFSASPWIGSKNNLYNKAVSNLEYSETKKYSENPEPWYSYKNPTLNAAAAATEATLAVPAEEFLRRMEAFNYMLNTSNSSWKRIAVAFGYEPWQLETKQQVEEDEKKHDQQMKIKQFEKATGEKKIKPESIRGKVRPGIN